MGKFTLKQLNAMSLGELIDATGETDFELVPSDVPGEDAEQRKINDESLQELAWKLGGQR